MLLNLENALALITLILLNPISIDSTLDTSPIAKILLLSDSIFAFFIVTLLWVFDALLKILIY